MPSELKVQGKQEKFKTGARWMCFACLHTARLKTATRGSTRFPIRTVLTAEEHEIARLAFLGIRRASPTWRCCLSPVLHITPIYSEKDTKVWFPPTSIPFLSHSSLVSPERFYRGMSCSWCRSDRFHSGACRSASGKGQQTPAKGITVSRQCFPWKTGKQERFYTEISLSLKWSSVVTSPLHKLSAEHLQRDLNFSPGLFRVLAAHSARGASNGGHLFLSGHLSFPCFSHPTKPAREITAAWRGAGRATGSMTALDIPPKKAFQRDYWAVGPKWRQKGLREGQQLHS